MVRDDFWLAVSRFLRELEVPLPEGHNIALADLFDLDHARRVLSAFGRAFGKLPDNLSGTTKEQKEFLKQSVAGLAEEGKVICVRLALFAEMMKGKTWSPATLKVVDGTKGIGITFLEETFSSSSASPEHRYHQIGPIRQQLRPDGGELTEQLRAILRNDKAEAHRRFRAAVALADYVPESEAASWTEQDFQFVADQLVLANAEFQPLLRENLRPISGRLLPGLERVFRDAKMTDAQRLSAANAFADYAARDPEMLSRSLVVATPEQYGVLFPLVAATPAPSTAEYLGTIAATRPPAELGSVERVRVEELLDFLRIVSDAAVDRYPRNSRYALLLALGEYPLNRIPESQREALFKQLGDWYRNDRQPKN